MEEEERDPREVLALVVAKAMEAKWALCEENGGITDAPPLLIGEFPNGDGFIAPDLNDGHPTETLPVLLTGLLQGMTQQFGTPKFSWLAYVVEGYCRPNTTEEDVANVERGEMEQEYKNNPATDIREGIIATVYPWEGEALAQTVLYRYSDNGLPIYDDVEDTEVIANASGGVIPDIFRMFIEHCHEIAKANNN